jgi:hypothetical protein
LCQPEFDDGSTLRLWSLPGSDPQQLNREDDPPEGVALRILVDDDLKEYAPPWPCEFRDGDFFAVESGLTLHESLSVRGWALSRE